MAQSAARPAYLWAKIPRALPPARLPTLYPQLAHPTPHQPGASRLARPVPPTAYPTPATSYPHSPPCTRPPYTRHVAHPTHGYPLPTLPTLHLPRCLPYTSHILPTTAYPTPTTAYPSYPRVPITRLPYTRLPYIPFADPRSPPPTRSRPPTPQQAYPTPRPPQGRSHPTPKPTLIATHGILAESPPPDRLPYTHIPPARSSAPRPEAKSPRPRAAYPIATPAETSRNPPTQVPGRAGPHSTTTPVTSP